MVLRNIGVSGLVWQAGLMFGLGVGLIFGWGGGEGADFRLGLLVAHIGWAEVGFWDWGLRFLFAL